MIGWHRRAAVVPIVLALAACASSSAPPSPTTTTAATGAATPTPAPAPVADFPVAAFSAITEDPVSAETAAAFATALGRQDVTSGGGMSATVMTPDGTWSGVTGKADGVRDLQVDDQFTIGSITKSVVAAQVLQMVEAGELALDDQATDHLPPDLGFDTNGATIRQLLGHRSGLPDYYEQGPLATIYADPQRVWTPAEVLDFVSPDRIAPGTNFNYAETNYLLLRLMIEHLRGEPLVTVLRDGVLAIDGLERLVVQPDERPTEPMAVPAGAPRAELEARGGYLPSLADVTAYTASGGIASDAASLARWWRALCAGEIVSEASLTEMSRFEPARIGSYGLGLSEPASGYAASFGNTGQFPGSMSWAACLPDHEAVIVVLTNHEVDDGHLAYSQGLARPLVEVLDGR